MGGWGRNIETLKIGNPKSISLVDINPNNIEHGKELYKNDSTIKFYCDDLNKWIEKDNSKYRLIVAMWTLSY